MRCEELCTAACGGGAELQCGGCHDKCSHDLAKGYSCRYACREGAPGWRAAKCCGAATSFLAEDALHSRSVKPPTGAGCLCDADERERERTNDALPVSAHTVSDPKPSFSQLWPRCEWSKNATARAKGFRRSGEWMPTEHESRVHVSVRTCHEPRTRGMVAGPFYTRPGEWISSIVDFDLLGEGDRVTGYVGDAVDGTGRSLPYPPLHMHHIHVVENIVEGGGQRLIQCACMHTTLSLIHSSFIHSPLSLSFDTLSFDTLSLIHSPLIHSPYSSTLLLYTLLLACMHPVHSHRSPCTCAWCRWRVGHDRQPLD